MNGPFRIAIASGKGGTGKTTLATGLATVLAGRACPPRMSTVRWRSRTGASSSGPGSKPSATCPSPCLKWTPRAARAGAPASARAASVCVNKADVNPEIARIEAEAAQRGIPVLGRIRHDEAVTMAQTRRRAVVEDGDGPAAADLRALWDRVRQRLGALGLARPPGSDAPPRSRSEPRRHLP